MATPPEQPWSNNEKNYLLAEIIKAANPPPNVLFNVIQSSQLQPRWEDTPLPPGRSLNSCRYAFEELRRSLLTPMGTAMAAPTPVLGPMAPTLKRPFPYESTYTGGPSGREIRPKPPATSSTHTQPSPTDPPTRKKRGRPTKAEALAKAEAAAATAAPYGEPSPISVQRLPAQTTPQPVAGPHTATMGYAASRTEEPKIGGPAPAPPFSSVTRMPIAAMLTPSAQEPQSGSHPHSDSSTGRRRRARSTKSEPSDSPTRQSASAGHHYESPYAGDRPNAPDIAARAAVLRHRDDQANVPQSRSTHEAAHDLPDTRHDTEKC